MNTCKSCKSEISNNCVFCSQDCEDQYNFEILEKHTQEYLEMQSRKEHTLFCNETSTGWDTDIHGDLVYDCHCGKGYFPGEY